MLEIGAHSDTNPLYAKLRSVYKDMKYRTTNPKSKAYPMYGGKGVYVSDEWKTLQDFLDTADQITGWDTEKFLNGELELDKDLKGIVDEEGHKFYSINSTTWTDRVTNAKATYKDLGELWAISPEGERFTFRNRTEFAEKHGLEPTSVMAVLNGKNAKVEGWQFFMSEPEPQLRYRLTNPEGESTVSSRPSDLAKWANVDPSAVYKLINMLDVKTVRKTRKTSTLYGWSVERIYV